MTTENQELQKIVERGAGWTETQAKERDELIENIEQVQKDLHDSQDALTNIHGKITIAERRVFDLEHLREDFMDELHAMETKIEASIDAKLSKQSELNQAENELDAWNSRLVLAKENLREHSDDIIKYRGETKKATEVTKEIHHGIEKSCREYKECGRRIDNVSADLEDQHQKISDLKKENEERMKSIAEKVTENQGLVRESQIIEKKKVIISEKIIEVDKQRLEYEHDAEELKHQLNKVGNVDLRMLQKEADVQKRQSDCLKRELEVLDRKKGLSEKNSSVVKDLIDSNVATLKVLQNELGGMFSLAKRHQCEIDNLSSSLKKESLRTDAASKNRRDAVVKLNEEDAKIEELQIQLSTAELLLAQKQNSCEKIKSECNLQSQKLAECQEEARKAEKELNVIHQEMSKLKVDINHTENDLILEHYNHYHIEEEKDLLKADLQTLREQVTEIDATIESNKDVVSELERSIDNMDTERDCYIKEYQTLIGNRDTIGSLLVQKNNELERVHEKIKTQQSILHHGEIQYRDIMRSLFECIERLKRLDEEKKTCVQLLKRHNDLVQQAHTLEGDIHRDKIKTTTLREELGRPFNLHRWRILEYQDPQKYANIQNIQKLQKQIIAITSSVGEKDKSIRQKERQYVELKRTFDHQPRVSEVLEQLDLYQSDLTDKNRQMKEIEFEIDVQKRRVHDLNQILKEMENEENQIKLEWITQITAK